MKLVSDTVLVMLAQQFVGAGALCSSCARVWCACVCVCMRECVSTCVSACMCPCVHVCVCECTSLCV